MLLWCVLPGPAQAQESPLARAGQLDLSGWDFDRDGIALLDGEWEFFWQRWVAPAEAVSATAMTDVPGHWQAGGNGFATYRLTVNCSQNTGLALSLPMQHSALTLYVNGTQVARQGQPSDTPQSYQPGVSHQTVALGNQPCPLRIVAHVANFDLFRGGMVRSIQLGTEAQLAQRRESALTRVLLALGGVLVMAVLALVFYFWRWHDRTPLYFGLFCLSLGVSLGLSGERAWQELVLGLGFENHRRLLFMNWFAGLALFPLFVRCLYPRDTPPWVITVIVAFSTAGVALAALTPVRVFSYSSPALQAGAIFVALAMALVLVKAWRRGSRPAAILLAGLGVMAGAVAHDVVFFRHLQTTSLVPYGLFGFVLAPAILLAQRFARALRSEELRALEQRERVDLLVRSTNAGLLDWNAASDEVSRSERYLEILGYAELGKTPPFRQLLHPDDHDRVHSAFMTQLRDRSVRSAVRVNEPMDYRMLCLDGRVVWVHAEAMSICGADGRTLRYICSFMDISERKHLEAELTNRISEKVATEQALSLERDRLRLLVSSTKAGFSDWDTTLGQVRYSSRFKEMLGWPGDTDTSSWPGIFEMVHPDDRERARDEFRGLLQRKLDSPGEPSGIPVMYRLRRRDGSYIWIHAEGIQQYDEQGRVRRFIASYLDVTAFREQEEALRRATHEAQDQTKFINDLVDALPIALSMRDREGRYVFANRTWERYYGFRREDIVGRTVRDQLTSAEADSVEALDRAALESSPGQAHYTADAPFHGREYTLMRTVMTNARHEPVGVVVATEDVTERRAIERALATEQHRIEFVVRAANVGILDWNGLKRTGYYSPRLCEILGYSPDADTTAWPDFFLRIHPDDMGPVQAEFRKHVTAKRAAGEMAYHDPVEYRLRRDDGSWVWVECMGVSQSDATGYTVQFIASFTDISERRAQQEALRASHDQIAAQAAELAVRNEALLENVRLREEVERISRHDIKTPLNSIVAVPRLLREERRLGPEADELLGIVERAGYRILSMVNLSLDLYKMEQGSYVVRPDAVDLGDLVRKVVDDMRMHAASRQVRLRVDLRGIGYAWAEELLCYSLLANLLKNAVEASPEGEEVSLLAGPGAAGSILLRIHNTGAVPEAIRGSFFQKYLTHGKLGGTGLGTYSARLMARVQEGDIHMKTSPVDGTTLTVTLRAAPAGSLPATMRHAAERHHIGPLQLASMAPTRVLLVDDDEYNLLIVRRFLPTPPFSVASAINGKMALAAAAREWPDIVFMDLDMPVMGGLQAGQALREMELATLAPRCTIVALTSHDDEATRRSSLAAGFDHYLSKPVTRDMIHEVVLAQRQLGGRPPAAPAALHPERIRPAATRHDAVIADPDVEPVLAGFMDSRRGLLDALEGAAGNNGEVRRIAHQLAGSFDLYGFRWASEQSRWIEGHFNELQPERLLQLASELRHHLDTVEIRFAPACAGLPSAPTRPGLVRARTESSS